jgi:hypothetical protein
MGGIVALLWALLWDFGPLVLELRRIPLLGSSMNRPSNAGVANGCCKAYTDL